MVANWKKLLIIGAPLVLVGSVGAYAASGSTNQAAKATASAPATSQPTVTTKTVSSQPLTADELAQLSNVQAAPVATNTSSSGTADTSTDISQSALDASNPFLVQSSTASGTTGAGDSSGSGGTDTSGTSGGNSSSGGFDISQVKNLQLQTNTTLGELVLHFTADDKNNLKLDGQLGNRHLQVSGPQAQQFLAQILQNLNLSDAFTSALQGQQVTLDNNLLSSLQNVQIEMKDGRKLTSQPKGDAKPSKPEKPDPGPGPGHGPKAEGRHDNGKHKGHE